MPYTKSNPTLNLPDSVEKFKNYIKYTCWCNHAIKFLICRFELFCWTVVTRDSNRSSSLLKYVCVLREILVRNGQRRVDPLAAIFNRQNQTGKVSRQKQEYQRQGRDVNNTRQKSGSQAQVQRSKVRQSGVKHRDSRMNGRTLRNVTRGKQDFALGECLCAAFMWVNEWGAGVVRQSGLMIEWWQLCDWCDGGRECVCAVHDGRCSPWVMCSLSEW